MQAAERQRRLEEYLSKAEFASLAELANCVSTSISTVRRDLNRLEELGHIRRTHGGACKIAPRSDEYIFSHRETIQLAEKDEIALAAAGLIQPGQTVIMDAGTTVFRVARQIERDGKTLHIITNSLPVANLFASNSNTEVIVSGGVIYPKLGVLVGPLAVEVFSKTYADVAIMSGAGISVEGVSNSHALLIDIQRAMIQAAARVIFCFDHTKIGRRSVAHLCELGDIDVVVTDPAAPAEIIDDLRRAGLEIFFSGQPGALPHRTQETASPIELTTESPSPASDLSGGMSWD